MNTLFQPRKAFDKKTGEQIDYISPGQDNFDKYYIKRVVKYVPVPLFEGSDDYVLDMKVIEDKVDIVETINSQANDVGLKAMLERFEKTGDPSCLPSPVNATDDILDLTKLPQDNAEYFEYIHGLADKYKSLPVELRQDMTLDEFVKKITDKQVNDWLESVKPVEKKVEDKKDE